MGQNSMWFSENHLDKVRNTGELVNLQNKTFDASSHACYMHT